MNRGKSAWWRFQDAVSEKTIIKSDNRLDSQIDFIIDKLLELKNHSYDIDLEFSHKFWDIEKLLSDLPSKYDKELWGLYYKNIKEIFENTTDIEIINDSGLRDQYQKAKKKLLVEY